jgi:hypothetical protein
VRVGAAPRDELADGCSASPRERRRRGELALAGGWRGDPALAQAAVGERVRHEVQDAFAAGGGLKPEPAGEPAGGDEVGELLALGREQQREDVVRAHAPVDRLVEHQVAAFAVARGRAVGRGRVQSVPLRCRRAEDEGRSRTSRSATR